MMKCVIITNNIREDVDYMIYFENLPLSKDILDALSELKIDYVFQPIFEPDGKTIYAREALMRPHGKNVMDLIHEYMDADKLHILEVATFFGACQAYILRGYDERVSINSFPNEVFTDEEMTAFVDYFGNDGDQVIIEMLEYPSFSLDKYVKKREIAKVGRSKISVDDYGTGINDMDRVKEIDPHIVKIDRSLICDIDKDVYKQANVKEIIDMLHNMKKIVVAEGIETKEEFDFLVSLGADLFQGYYLGRPA